MNPLQKWQAIAYLSAGAFGGALLTYVVLLIASTILDIQ